MDIPSIAAAKRRKGAGNTFPAGVWGSAPQGVFMRYTIENEFIRLTIDSLGAEMVSAVDRATGSEMISVRRSRRLEPPRADSLFPMQAS